MNISINCAIAITAALSLSLTADDSDSFQPLFDGKSLKGWRGDPAHWTVSAGAIIGSTRPAGRKSNTFLIAKGEFEDFFLRAKFKLTNGASGIQFRSRPIGKPNEFLVTGYQADIGGGDTGTFYEEKGRGTLVPPNPDIVKAHYKEDDWNQYEIKMIGNTGEIRLNGHLTARFTETEETIPLKGVVALQLQAGTGMEIAFKDIEIRVLNPK